MALIDEINGKRMEIRTDGYPMSIGEWISLYEKKELDIHPEFQRFYRWDDYQKSSLIESILLGIPVPSIFVTQRKDGVWDVVDGLQRLSTIFQLLGILKNEKEKLVAPLVLSGTKYLPSLKNTQWESPENPTNEIPPEAKLLFKRSKIAVNIILKESDENAKYDLFQRLNTGGSKLSPQEVRNCLMVMLNDKMYKWIKELATYENFKQCIALSDSSLEEAYDVELVLRFVVFLEMDNNELKNIGDVGVFLTDKMSNIALKKKFPKTKYEAIFKNTFDALFNSVGSDAFKRYNKSKNRHEGGFLLSQYEVIALGLAYNITTLSPTINISTKIQSIWGNTHYTSWAGSGITATRRLPRIVPLGRALFK
jgi:uncharacterized protein with ParB-like and HNH nuclease domain